MTVLVLHCGLHHIQAHLLREVDNVIIDLKNVAGAFADFGGMFVLGESTIPANEISDKTKVFFL